MSSNTNIWETGVNNEGNGSDNNQYYISDSVNRLTIQRGTGNIGIGTNAPSQLLDVSGNINLTGNIYLSNTGTIYKNGQEYAIGSSGGTSTLWQENENKIYYNAGNVGINTSDPSETLEVAGNIKATNIEAVGANITSLNATNITSGTLDNARLPADIDVTSLKGTGANITSLNATNITSGTLDNARLPADIDVTSLKGTGANITSLNATNITSGTLDNARLPADIDVTGNLTAKNLSVTGVTTTINTDTYQTENLEIISTGADGPSLKITHDTASHDILQVTDTTSTQSLTMTHDGKIGIGTTTPSAPLHIYDTTSASDIFKVSEAEITINRSIIPETNDAVDIGSAERKIRDMYISDNSLWLGDDHKLAITSDGTMKFRKRNKSVLPKVLRDTSGTDAAAIAHVNQKYGTSFANVSDFKLNHVLSYARTINPGYKTSEVFGEDTQDYEQDTAIDAWQVNSSKIFLGSDYANIGIGTNDPDPAFKLDVTGNINTTGNISAENITIKGSAESGSGAIKLNCEQNSHGVSIKGPPHAASQSYTLTLPSTAPEASKVLSTDASGNLSWVDPGSSSSSSIQNITTTASKVTIDTEMDVTNNVTIKGSGVTGSGSIKLNCEQNSHGVVIKGPPHAYNQSYTLTLPSTAPEASKVLSTDASGNLSWVEQTAGNDYYTKAEINSAGYLTSHQSLNDYYTKAEINSAGYLTSHQSLDDYYTKAEINSAGYLTSHQSLNDYYTKAEINSAGYLTSHQSLELYALKTDLNNFYQKTLINNLLYDDVDSLQNRINTLENAHYTYITTVSNRINTLENTHNTDITNVNNIINTLVIPPGVPVDLLVMFPPAELIFTSDYTTINIGTHRNFTTQLKETKDNTNWNYITYNGVGYGTNNTFNAYENDSITINGSYFWSHPSDSYHLGNIYTSLLYVKKNSPVTIDILTGIGNVSANVEGKVGTIVIDGDFTYSGFPNQNTTVSTTIQYTFPKNINPEYEFRIFHGGIIEWADIDTFISNAAYVVIITRAVNSIINNDTIEDLPIEKVKFSNTTGFLKITNGNLSYDTTVSYLEEKINMILDHLDLN